MTWRVSFLPMLTAFAVLVLAAAFTACASEAAPLGAAVPPTGFFVNDDGAPAQWSAEASPHWRVFDDVLPPARAREVAFDADSGLLWYSDNHARVASIEVGSLRSGPSIGGFSDVALVGCSVTGRPRTLAIDVGRRALLVPQLTGGVLEYGLDDLALRDVIRGDVFGESTLGAFRHLAVAPDGHLWFISADGSVVEVDRATGPTGRRVVLEQRVVAIAGDGSAAPVVRTEDGAVGVLDEAGDAVVRAQR